MVFSPNTKIVRNWQVQGPSMHALTGRVSLFAFSSLARREMKCILSLLAFACSFSTSVQSVRLHRLEQDVHPFDYLGDHPVASAPVASPPLYREGTAHQSAWPAGSVAANEDARNVRMDIEESVDERADFSFTHMVDGRALATGAVQESAMAESTDDFDFGRLSLREPPRPIAARSIWKYHDPIVEPSASTSVSPPVRVRLEQNPARDSVVRVHLNPQPQPSLNLLHEIQRQCLLNVACSPQNTVEHCMGCSGQTFGERLRCCGRAVHRECLQNWVKRQQIQFPICCPGCLRPWETQ